MGSAEQNHAEDSGFHDTLLGSNPVQGIQTNAERSCSVVERGQKSVKSPVMQ